VSDQGSLIGLCTQDYITDSILSFKNLLESHRVYSIIHSWQKYNSQNL